MYSLPKSHLSENELITCTTELTGISDNLFQETPLFFLNKTFCRSSHLLSYFLHLFKKVSFLLLNSNSPSSWWCPLWSSLDPSNIYIKQYLYNISFMYMIFSPFLKNASSFWLFSLLHCQSYCLHGVTGKQKNIYNQDGNQISGLWYIS